MSFKPIKITVLDVVIVLAIATVGGYTAYRLNTNIHYHWRWDIMFQYLFHKNPDTGRWTPNLLMQGFFTTLRLSVWAMLLATIIGAVVGFFRVSPSRFKRMTGRTFVELIRNTPPLVLIFIFYYFIGDQIMPLLGLDHMTHRASPATQHILSSLLAPPRFLTAFVSATITLAVVEAAYIAEIVRAGIQSVEKGQIEASYALGLSWRQQMQFIVLPQAVQTVLPALAGQFISTIKDSAIVSVISIPELCFQGMELVSATYLTFECWITIAGLYLILTLSLSIVVERIEIMMKKKSSHIGRM